MQPRGRSPKKVRRKERVGVGTYQPSPADLAARVERFKDFLPSASQVAEDSGHDRTSCTKRASSADQGHDRAKVRYGSNRSKREPSSHQGYGRAAADRDVGRYQNQVNATHHQDVRNYGHGRPAQQNARVRSRPVSQRPPRASSATDATDFGDDFDRLVHVDPQPDLAVIISVV